MLFFYDFGWYLIGPDPEVQNETDPETARQRRNYISSERKGKENSEFAKKSFYQRINKGIRWKYFYSKASLSLPNNNEE